MSKVVNTRLQERDFEILEKIAKEEHLDLATLVRKWIIEKIEEYRIMKQTKLYQKGIVSLAEAATDAGVSIYRMMEFLKEKNVHAPEQSIEEIRTEYSESVRIVSDKLERKKKK